MGQLWPENMVCLVLWVLKELQPYLGQVFYLLDTLSKRDMNSEYIYNAISYTILYFPFIYLGDIVSINGEQGIVSKCKDLSTEKE